MVSCGGSFGTNPCSQNMAQLLRQRREGTIPASSWGRVSGGHTSARSASAGARGWGFHGFYGVSGEGDGCVAGSVGDSSSFGFRRSVGEHPSMIERLGRTATLKGHAQCVNRLCWNESGTALASCSDDTTVCLFDAASAKRKLQFNTGHTRNILGVRILPCTNDQVMVTGAMDSQVRLHKAPFSSEELTETFDCHEGRVNAVEVEPGNPNIFWSASEDGTVRQFDRRMTHGGCGWTSGSSTGHDDTRGAHFRRSRSATNCLVALTSEGSGLGDLEGFFGRSSVSQSGRPQAGRANHVVCNPCDTNYLAVACGDLFARVFDRRTLSLGKASELRSSGRRRRHDPRSGSIPALSVCPTHEHLAAGGACGSDISGRVGEEDSEGSVERMMRSPLIGGHHSTCVAFSPDGRNLLVSYHRDHVYLFDATGAKRSSTAVSDAAISSYFMPAPSSRLAHADTKGGERRGGGDGGGKGPPRRSVRWGFLIMASG